MTIRPVLWLAVLTLTACADAETSRTKVDWASATGERLDQDQRNADPGPVEPAVAVSLVRVTSGGITVDLKKTGAGCVVLVDQAGKALSREFLCEGSGNNVLTLPLDAMLGKMADGSKVKLCLAADLGICSSEIVVHATAASDEATDPEPTVDEGPLPAIGFRLTTLVGSTVMEFPGSPSVAEGLGAVATNLSYSIKDGSCCDERHGLYWTDGREVPATLENGQVKITAQGPADSIPAPRIGDVLKICLKDSPETCSNEVSVARGRVKVLALNIVGDLLIGEVESNFDACLSLASSANPTIAIMRPSCAKVSGRRALAVQLRDTVNVKPGTSVTVSVDHGGRASGTIAVGGEAKPLAEVDFNSSWGYYQHLRIRVTGGSEYQAYFFKKNRSEPLLAAEAPHLVCPGARYGEWTNASQWLAVPSGARFLCLKGRDANGREQLSATAIAESQLAPYAP